MQSKLQEHTRVDIFLDKCLVVKIGNNKTILDENYNLLNNLNAHQGCQQIHDNSFLKYFPGSFIQVHDMGHIPYLENYRLGHAEIATCNKEGLWIFLSEQASHTIGEKSRIVLGEKNIPKWLQDYQYIDSCWSPELESIETFIKNNNLKNVKVNVGFDPKDIYKKDYTLQRYDVVLNALTNLYAKKDNQQTHLKSGEIDTHFWCGSLRYSVPRHLVTAFASTLDTMYSWVFTDYNNTVLDNIWFDINNFKHKEKLSADLVSLQSRNIDFAHSDVSINGSASDILIRPKESPQGPHFDDYSSHKTYGNTFISLINASTFCDPVPSYDEKPLNAMYNVRPFIMFGPANSLALMKQDGFETFDKYWDESYDAEENNEKRLSMLFDLLLEINTWSIDKCQKTYADMVPQLYRNYLKIQEGMLQVIP